jgi:hypothetical protein
MLSMLERHLPEVEEEGFEPLSRVRAFVYDRVVFDHPLNQKPQFFIAVYYTLKSWENPCPVRMEEVTEWLLSELVTYKRVKTVTGVESGRQTGHTWVGFAKELNPGIARC